MEHQLTISKTVRYFTYGNEETADNIWIVLHGYSQLPKYFINKFKELDPTKNFIVAPEGMHRFYRRGASGRVGASWMTKEARLDDIDDNILYLNKLADKLLENRSYSKKILLGFSQGGATAARWHQNGNFNADHFILWASVFPPDVSFEDSKGGMFDSDNYFVVGTEDEFFKGKIDEMEDFHKNQPYKIKFRTFNGTHDIDSTMLKEIALECQ